MARQENQRVMLTRRLIKESLVRLLEQESIYKLTKKSTLEDLAELDTNSEYWLQKMRRLQGYFI